MVTIIIPFYNSKSYIKKTLRSLENQTYKSFKVIFVDDGSTDGTSEYINYYYKDKNIDYKIIRTEHRGVSHARNIGLSYVNTPYLMFLDSDDYIENDALKISIDYLTKYDLDAVVFKYDRKLHDKSVWEYSNSYFGFSGFIDGVTMLNEIFDNRVHIIISNVIYRSSLAKGLRFCEQSSFHEDIHFCYRVICRAKKIGFIPFVLIHYVIRYDSITRQLTVDKLVQAVHTLKSLYDYLANQIEKSVAEKINTKVIPETLLHFFKNLSIRENIIDVFRNNGYLNYMKKHVLSRRNFRYFLKYLQIKWIAYQPSSYLFFWKLYSYHKKKW